MKTTGCVICGSDLNYRVSATAMQCCICGEQFWSDVSCSAGHFVCDTCHQLDATGITEAVCLRTSSTNPFELANRIMNHSLIHMHGPEHHFLVPAVLLTACFHAIGTPELIPEKLAVCRDRASKVPGGVCGFHGNCGAAVGTGIFMSIFLNATPISGNEWKLSNLMTSRSLYAIAMAGGPRCCKRDTWLALETAIDFLKEQFGIELNRSNQTCGHFARNKQCLASGCKYFPAHYAKNL